MSCRMIKPQRSGAPEGFISCPQNRKYLGRCDPQSNETLSLHRTAFHNTSKGSSSILCHPVRLSFLSSRVIPIHSDLMRNMSEKKQPWPSRDTLAPQKSHQLVTFEENRMGLRIHRPLGCRNGSIRNMKEKGPTNPHENGLRINVQTLNHHQSISSRPISNLATTFATMTRKTTAAIPIKEKPKTRPPPLASSKDFSTISAPKNQLPLSSSTKLKWSCRCCRCFRLKDVVTCCIVAKAKAFKRWIVMCQSKLQNSSVPGTCGRRLTT